MYKKNVNEELKKYDVNDLKAMNKLLMDLRQSDEEDISNVLKSIKKIKSICIVCCIICISAVVLLLFAFIGGGEFSYESNETVTETTTETTNKQTVEGDNATFNNVQGDKHNGGSE